MRSFVTLAFAAALGWLGWTPAPAVAESIVGGKEA